MGEYCAVYTVCVSLLSEKSCKRSIKQHKRASKGDKVKKNPRKRKMAVVRFGISIKGTAEVIDNIFYIRCRKWIWSSLVFARCHLSVAETLRERLEAKIISSALRATFTNHLSSLIAAITQRNARRCNTRSGPDPQKTLSSGLIRVYDTLPAAVWTTKWARWDRPRICPDYHNTSPRRQPGKRISTSRMAVHEELENPQDATSSVWSLL